VCRSELARQQLLAAYVLQACERTVLRWQDREAPVQNSKGVGGSDRVGVVDIGSLRAAQQALAGHETLTRFESSPGPNTVLNSANAQFARSFWPQR
jgi:hypothetical protein